MRDLFLASLTSLTVTILLVHFKNFHIGLSGDSDFSAPQKFHTTIVPRIGGIAVAAGLLNVIVMKTYRNFEITNPEIALLLCATPIFAIGIAEDCTKKISITTRLLFSAMSATCIILILNIQITSIGIPTINNLFTIPFFGITFSIFAICGLSNAYNIIDGFNGLSSMVGIITLLGLAFIGYTLGDESVTFLSLTMVGAILGFFILNYPSGKIFLGDSGAYLIGFWIASLSILVCAKHPNVSPWFALLINGYPVTETLFTIYRRKIHQDKNPGAPDGIHFHTLVYRRISRINRHGNPLSANARTAPYLWALTSLSVIPALLWWQSTMLLIGSSALFIFFYLWLYSRLVRFKTPPWIIFK